MTERDESQNCSFLCLCLLLGSLCLAHCGCVSIDPGTAKKIADTQAITESILKPVLDTQAKVDALARQLLTEKEIAALEKKVAEKETEIAAARKKARDETPDKEPMNDWIWIAILAAVSVISPQAANALQNKKLGQSPGGAASPGART